MFNHECTIYSSPTDSDVPTTRQTAPVDAARLWLERFPATRRSLLANLFHHAHRAGFHTTTAMLAAVRQEVIRRWRAAQNANDRKFWVSVGESFKSPDAATYALHVQQWEQLSLAERQARKAERAQPYQQQHMAHKPPRLVKKPMRPCRQWLV